MIEDKKTSLILLALKSLLEVFSNFWYWCIMLIVSASVLLFAIWLPNLSFIRSTIVSNIYTLQQKFSLLISSLGALQTNFTTLSETLTIIVALLFGLNIALLIYYLKKRIRLQRSSGLGVIGIISGLIGVGCASCGSVILSSIFGLGATAGFIGVLPLKGQEFGLLSIAIILFSIFLLAKKIQDPNSCKIKVKPAPSQKSS